LLSVEGKSAKSGIGIGPKSFVLYRCR
jgi:hypothetical protein